VDVGQPVDNAFEELLFAAQALGAGRVVPDSGILEFAVDDFEPVLLPIEVKDTSEVRRLARAGRRAGLRADSGVRLPSRDSS
jgi:hypothetical protein